MHALQAGGGSARQFYDRHHLLVVSIVLSVAGVVTGAASAMAATEALSPFDIAAIAAGVVLGAAICLVQTRHLPLAILTALAPVPGLLWAAPLSAGSDFGVLPLLGYAFGFCVATLNAEAFIDRVVARKSGEPPWRAAAVALVSMAAVVFLWRSAPEQPALLQAVADCVLSAVSAVLLLPLVASWLHFDEAFIVRTNREREWLGRVFRWMAHVTLPRWALSFTGIAAIFLALGWFGAAPLLRGNVVLGAASVALVSVASGIFCGGWREGLAAGFVATAVVLVTLWAGVAAATVVPAGTVVVLAVWLLLALHGGRAARAWRRRNEVPVIAQRRMVEQAGGPFFAILGAIAVLLPGVLFHPSAKVLVVGLFTAAFGALAFVPAVATALEVMVPRRRSVEDLYSRRKKPVAE